MILIKDVPTTLMRKRIKNLWAFSNKVRALEREEHFKQQNKQQVFIKKLSNVLQSYIFVP